MLSVNQSLKDSRRRGYVVYSCHFEMTRDPASSSRSAGRHPALRASEPELVVNKPESRAWRWAIPVGIFLGAAIVFGLFSWDRILQPSNHFHFLDLANSFLDGRLDTDSPTRHRGVKPKPEDRAGRQEAIDRHLTDGRGNAVGWNDWASVRRIKLTDDTVVRGVFPWSDQQGGQKNKFVGLDQTMRIIDPEKDIARGCGSPQRKCDETDYYVSFPPFPAVVFLPLVAIFGYNVNDVLFTVLNGALNCVLLFLLLEMLVVQGLSKRTRRENLILAILFGFGTVHFFSTIRGEVWFSALIMGVSLHMMYVMMATGTRHPFLAGLFLAMGMATRTPITFAFVFFALELFRDGDRMRWPGWAFLIRKGILFALPILVGGILLMFYNYYRFESPFEFGHKFLANGTRASIREHGLFSFWFLKNNLSAMITNPPVIDVFRPFIHITRHGLGLFWTTPVFLLLLWPKEFGAYARNAAITVGIVAIPLVFYQNTGWAQFGYRFGLDFMPYLFVLLAVGGRRFGRGFAVAFVLSILMNVLGAVTFDRIGMFYYD